MKQQQRELGSDLHTGRSESPPDDGQPASSPESEPTSSRSTEEDTVEETAPVVINHPLINQLLQRFSNLRIIDDPCANARNLFTKRKCALDPAPILTVDLRFEELRQLCNIAIDSFSKQKSLLRIGKEILPITICADTHGQFRDLNCIFAACGYPPVHSYLFLGDYVDRGAQGIETFSMLLCYKIKYPDRVFMLRGNHEDANTTLTYGFYDECMNRYESSEQGELLWHIFLTVFNMMPLAALICNRILCMHGGLSPYLTNLKVLEDISRPSLVPPYGLMCDTLWSDPDDRYPGWALSARGISFTFSTKIIKEFCEAHDIELIVRGHQLTTDMFKGGYKFFAGGRLVTIFSAPNYLNMRNDSCVLHVSKKFKCRFTVFRPVPSSKQEKKMALETPPRFDISDGC